MVEIINQRKAFLDMLAWSEELITDVRKPKSWLWRHCRRRAIYRLPDHLANLSRQTQNSNQQAPDATSFFPVGGMPTASSLAWKTSLRKVRTLWHCSRLRSVALYLWLIVDIRQGNRPLQAISGLHCRALVMVSSSTRPTARLQNSKKRAERSERLMTAEHYRDYLRSGYLHHRLPVMGC